MAERIDPNLFFVFCTLSIGFYAEQLRYNDTNTPIPASVEQCKYEPIVHLYIYIRRGPFSFRIPNHKIGRP